MRAIIATIFTGMFLTTVGLFNNPYVVAGEATIMWVISYVAMGFIETITCGIARWWTARSIDKQIAKHQQPADQQQ